MVVDAAGSLSFLMLMADPKERFGTSRSSSSQGFQCTSDINLALKPLWSKHASKQALLAPFYQWRNRQKYWTTCPKGKLAAKSEMESKSAGFGLLLKQNYWYVLSRCIGIGRFFFKMLPSTFLCLHHVAFIQLWGTGLHSQDDGVAEKCMLNTPCCPGQCTFSPQPEKQD